MLKPLCHPAGTQFIVITFCAVAYLRGKNKRCPCKRYGWSKKKCKEEYFGEVDLQQTKIFQVFLRPKSVKYCFLKVDYKKDLQIGKRQKNIFSC